MQGKHPTLAAQGQEAVIQRIVQLIRDLTRGEDVLPGGIKGIGIGSLEHSRWKRV
jgi:hypothetical protein